MNIKTVQIAAGLFAAALLVSAGVAMAAPGGPTVTLSSTASSTTNATSVPVTAVFSENVNGFTAAGASTTNATVTGFSGSGNTYTFSLVPTSQGAFSVFIPANVATSASSSIGNQQSNTLNFTYDNTAPVISNVSVATTSTTAAITWNTDEPAFGQILYGTSASYGSQSTLEASASTTHSALITGLSPSTTYHFQVRSTDQAGNLATTSDATFAAAPGVLSISGIGVSNIGTSTATIGWTTNLPSDSRVNYGTTASYGSSAYNPTATTTHSIVLSNLSEATLYRFDVQSTAVGSTTSATSNDQEFVTASTASTTPLAIDSITSVKTSGIADNLFADGWEWVIHFTVPDNENAFRIRFSDWGNPLFSFPAAGDIRVSSAQSSNATSSSSAITAMGNGYTDWLYLTGDEQPLQPGRQIDLEVDVKIPFGTPPGSYTSNFTAQTYPSTATSTAM